MRPVISALANYVAEHSAIFLPAALFLISTFSEVATPIPHSLLISSASWAIIWVYNSLRVGVFSGLRNVTRSRLSWAAGAFFALAQVCQRAAWDRDGIWLFKAFLPVVVLMLLEANTFFVSSISSLGDDKASQQGSKLGLSMVTILAASSFSLPFITSQGVALGICGILMVALSFVTMEWALLSTKDEKSNGRGFMMANGSFSRRISGASIHSGQTGTNLRDAAGVIAISCALASYTFESFRADSIAYNRPMSLLGGNWQLFQNVFIKLQVALMILVGVFENALLFSMIRDSGAFLTSFVSLSACLTARLITGVSLRNIWFTICSGVAIVVYLNDTGSFNQSSFVGRLNRKSRQLVALLCVASVVFMFAQVFQKPAFPVRAPPEEGWAFTDPEKPLAPKRFASTKVHPVDQLIRAAEADFQTLLEKQSKSLGEAVAEYKRRYKIHPPPNFDKWYEYATRRGVKLIDEFDTIHHTILPFWGLEPATIRARARESLGFDENFLIGVLIRNGAVVKVERGEEWQQQATVGMMEQYVQHLPDMDLAFNIHDEPRVVVPSDKLSRLVNLALNDRMPKALANASPRSSFSSRPEDLSEGKRIEPVAYSRFNRFAHQATWTHSRMSCPPDSPAQTYEEFSNDNLTSYALGDLGFVHNQTAFTDICMLPSVRKSHAFFDCPNAFNLVTELFPVFSQSKISSFQDILYPSPWYWSNKVTFQELRDVPWDKKANAIYWRGSTTGGYSRLGGWRRHHRQHVVRKFNSLDTANILTKTDSGWNTKEVKRSELKELVDVHFSHVGQCDEGDCEAQTEFFDVVERVDSQDAWGWKHLLDMDGNAFSGRFYAFLHSTSLIYKMSIFQEWHMEWVKPWVHYIPLSLRGEEWLEILRYFSLEKEGQEQAPRMADQSREWARTALRNEDIEVWFFRLLLEYGRVIDDDRENIGYTGP